MAEKRDIKYINRDFDSFRNSLIEFSKTYFPTTYTDFSPTSPGMMFIEMSSYVGDVLSFYLDNQIQENFIQYARQDENLYSLAYSFGYRPKVTEASIAEIELFQQVPAIEDGSGQASPDFRYALNFAENTRVKSSLNSGTEFLIEDSTDFTISSSADPTNISVYQVNENGVPQYYLLKKARQAISATINSTTFTFGSPEKFSTVEINGADIIKILDVTDSDGNKWYEVPYLAQDVILDSLNNSPSQKVFLSNNLGGGDIEVNTLQDPNFYKDSQDTPKLLRLKKVQRRFVSRFKNASTLELQFGAGTVADNDAQFTPNSDNVGIGLPFTQDKLTTAYSPTSFTFTDTYGIAPSNTTLTVRYLTGGGISSNVASNTITKFVTTNTIKFITPNLDPTLSNYVFNSIAVNNPRAATGGKDGDTIEELRFNTLNTFQTQLRSVTQEDYLVRALSMPSEYGSVSKIYAEPEKIEDLLPGEVPSSLSLYVLAFDQNKRLKLASPALKQNLITYLSQYRMINDSVKIKNGFIINIGVDFELITLPNYNSNEILNKCITSLKEYFDIDNWQINQPIILRELYILLDKIEGVQTVKNINIYNKVGETLGYSKYAYDITGATQNNIIYPSLDPSIFEVKYPNVDIRGRIVNF